MPKEFQSVQSALKKDEDRIKFKTFDDPLLVKLLNKVQEWVEMPNSKKPMLTLSGPPERGKTTLLKEVFRLFSTYECEFKYHKFGYPRFLYVVWSELTGEALQDPRTIDKIANAGIVFIEDFLSDEFFEKHDIYQPIKLNNYLRIQLDFAFRIMNARVGKATMIDSNKNMKQFKILDERIYSRFTRENGIFLDITDKIKPFHDR